VSSSTGPRRADQVGAATTLVVVLAAVLVVVTLSGLAVGGAVVDQRRAESAADLAALAGATSAAAGRPACPSATFVARRNGVSLVRCREDGLVVEVMVRRSTRIGLLRLVPGGLTVSGVARAGPRRLGP